MSDTPSSASDKPAAPSAFVSRRRFIQLGVGAVCAAWAGTVLQTQLFPSTTSTAAKPVAFPLSDLPIGSAKPIAYAGSPAIVLRTAESIKAFSLVCTHLSCTVEWQPGSREFYCPCHDGRYDEFGEVLAGPPPVPLEALAVKVDGDTVIVGEEA